jgi:hypothetical protein
MYGDVPASVIKPVDDVFIVCVPVRFLKMSLLNVILIADVVVTVPAVVLATASDPKERSVVLDPS